MTNIAIIEAYKIEHKISCPLHTYAKWQELGYQVKKGEKSQHKIAIWKGVTKKVHDNESNTDLTKCKVIPKVAAFFTINQVEKIESN